MASLQHNLSHRKHANIRKVILNFVHYLHKMIKTISDYFDEDVIYGPQRGAINVSTVIETVPQLHL